MLNTTRRLRIDDSDGHFWHGICPRKVGDMEILIFALIATRKGYTQHAVLVSEPAKFQPFELRLLKHSYSAEENSPGRMTVRKRWVLADVAS